MDRNAKTVVIDGPRLRPEGHSLTIDLAGPLILQDLEGRELTPKSRKAQGMLALIATSPRLRRSRSWLQDKLWSDRDQEHGASSLRQCLCDVRHALGKHCCCIKSESGWISLDSAYVLVRAEFPHSKYGEAEFLEGLDIRDPEFENWLRERRAAFLDSADYATNEESKAGYDSLPLTFTRGKGRSNRGQDTLLGATARLILLDLLANHISDQQLKNLVEEYSSETNFSSTGRYHALASGNRI